jgi:hypothetical protein
MRKIQSALLGAAALALAGTAALAASSDVHHMTVRLADGSTAQIEYTGDVAPRVSIQPMRPLGFAAFGPQVAFAPFGDFARIRAQMDAQMHRMMQQAHAMMAMPMGGNGAIEAAFGKMPGAHFCSQSVRITTDANGKQNVERHSSGDCGGASDKPAAADHSPQLPHRGTPI